jgi:hypothetical protein
MRARIFPTVAAVVTLGLGLGVRAFLGGWFAKYAGVALWATLVYFLILWVRPSLSPPRAFTVCVVISFAVELAQLTPGPMALYGVHPLFALVFGTTFNAPDLPAYVIGAAIAAGAQRTLSPRAAARSTAGEPRTA